MFGFSTYKSTCSRVAHAAPRASVRLGEGNPVCKKALRFGQFFALCLVFGLWAAAVPVEASTPGERIEARDNDRWSEKSETRAGELTRRTERQEKSVPWYERGLKQGGDARPGSNSLRPESTSKTLRTADGAQAKWPRQAPAKAQEAKPAKDPATVKRTCPFGRCTGRDTTTDYAPMLNFPSPGGGHAPSDY